MYILKCYILKCQLGVKRSAAEVCYAIVMSATCNYVFLHAITQDGELTKRNVKVYFV